MPAVDIVLVRPATPANVGAVARVVRNTGMRRLVLVDPDVWQTEQCWRTAWRAHEVLERARVHEHLNDAIQGAAYVAAFSARQEDEAVSTDIRQLASEVSALPDGETAALVFGPEGSGLTLAELATCGRRVRIPTDPSQPSLNLSHAVAIAAYEVFRSDAAAETSPPRAAHGEKEQLLELLRPSLEALGVLPEDRAERYFREWRRLVSRSDLTPRELGFLEFLARRALRRLGAASPGPAPAPEPPARREGAEAPGFADVESTASGCSIPQLKWRELLFTGAVIREGDTYSRNPHKTFPRFAQPDVLPLGVHFRLRFEAGRAVLVRCDPD